MQLGPQPFRAARKGEGLSKTIMARDVVSVAQLG